MSDEAADEAGKTLVRFSYNARNNVRFDDATDSDVTRELTAQVEASMNIRVCAANLVADHAVPTESSSSLICCEFLGVAGYAVSNRG